MIRKNLFKRHKLEIINLFWLFVDKFVKGIAIFATNIAIANYLGAEKFGLLSYAINLSLIMFAISELGLSQVLVKEFVKNISNSGIYFVTTIFLRLPVLIICYIFIYFFISSKSNISELEITTVLLITFSIIFKISDVVKHLLEALVLSKYSVYIESIVIISISAIKFYCVHVGSPFLVFVYLILLEAIVICAVHLILIKRMNFLTGKIRFSLHVAISLVKQSWLLCLGAILTAIYMKFDVFFLEEFSGFHEVGIYSVAVKFSEIFFFIALAVNATFAPKVIRAFYENQIKYHEHMFVLFKILSLMAFALIGLMFIFKSKIFVYAVDKELLMAADVFAVLILSNISVFTGILCNQHLIIAEAQNIIFIKALLATITCFALNFLLTPDFGAIGAAYAYVGSSFVATFSLILFKSQRKITKLMFVAPFISYRKYCRIEL